jgi:diguanylate cyclase (GGDEF)-like protein
MKIYDELTGLYNGEGFLGKVEECLEKHSGQDYQLIRFDIKNFKFVNAIFGRRSGNMLLAEIGETLKENEYPGEVCGRIDSDRFAVFIHSSYSDSLTRLILNTKFRVKDSNAYPVHICIGIYNIREQDRSVAEMCDRAGMALVTAKSNLLEQKVFYNEKMYERLLLEHELSMQLPEALQGGQLVCYLQPQSDEDGVIKGAEALVRWMHPQRGLMMPAEFVPFFERNYMIVEIDQFIWEEACKILQKWMNEGREDMYISVNVSARDLESIDVYKTLMGLVEKYDLNPSMLKVEITEGTIMQNPLRQIKLIGKLRTAGFYVEMDDFGSGYSSISMLKDIEIDAVKMDMRFFGKTDHMDRSRKIIESMVNLLRDFEMTIIAEGVETKRQVDFLSSISCDIFQGYYFSKPVTVEEFERKVFCQGSN